MGNTPAQIVTIGMAMKKGAVIAPTKYDQTPLAYMTRCSGDRPRTKKGQNRLKKSWKWPLHQRDRFRGT